MSSQIAFDGLRDLKCNQPFELEVGEVGEATLVPVVNFQPDHEVSAPKEDTQAVSLDVSKAFQALVDQIVQQHLKELLAKERRIQRCQIET